MISKLDAHERPIKTWSDASTVNILKDIAKEKNIDFHLLDAKDIFDHYHNDPIYEKYINEYYWSMANGIYNLQYAYAVSYTHLDVYKRQVLVLLQLYQQDIINIQMKLMFI